MKQSVALDVFHVDSQYYFLIFFPSCYFQTLKNRKIRVDLATHAGRASDRGGMDRDGRSSRRYDDEDRTAGDWRMEARPDTGEDRSRDYDRRGGGGGYDRGKIIVIFLLLFVDRLSYVDFTGRERTVFKLLTEVPVHCLIV